MNPLSTVTSTRPLLLLLFVLLLLSQLFLTVHARIERFNREVHTLSLYAFIESG